MAVVNRWQLAKVLMESHASFTNSRIKMAEDAESDIAIRFVDEKDYREISAKAVSAKWKLKKNRPSSLV